MAADILLTDLHTHILPGVDDGAEDLDKALQMLRAQKVSGVERVALTPHFYPMQEELDVFLQTRQQAYETLVSQWDAASMPQLRLGAEVHFSPVLADMDLRQIALEKTDYLLIELSDTVMPAFLEPVLQRILDQGFTPILAHVERCVYFAEKPARLLHLIQMGALAQISLRMLPTKRMGKFAEICLQKDVAQIIASDIHTLGAENTTLGALAAAWNYETVMRAESVARAVWENIPLPELNPLPIQRKLFGYT